MRNGSLSLIALGLIGIAFFAATDPRLGWGLRLDGDPQTNVVDAAHNARPGTIVGLAVSSAAAVGGLWLAARRLG